MGFGVVGITSEVATSGRNAKAGVEGIDAGTGGSLNSGVYGSSPRGNGLYGATTSGIGLRAEAASGTGVRASSVTGGNGISAIAGPPQFTGVTNTGVFAQAANGNGVVGIGSASGVIGFASDLCLNGGTNYGCSKVFGDFTGQIGVGSYTAEGGLGLDVRTDIDDPGTIGQSGVGAVIDAGSVGMMLTNDRGFDGSIPDLIVAGDIGGRNAGANFVGAIITGYNAVSVTGAAIGLATTGQTAIVAASDTTLFQGTTSRGTTVAKLDAGGNLTLAGNVVQHGTFTTAIHNADGTSSAAYGTQSTRPVLDDMGEGALANGEAFVPIDAALAKSMDVSQGYLVFLTPQGETTGLYVTGKSMRGFSVREIANGHHSLAFDYRIVAHPYGQSGVRLAQVDATLKATAQGPMFYRHIGKLRFSHGKLDKSSLPKPSM